MTTEDFEKLIDRDKYQVFVLMSSAALPFITFRHPWFVVNQKGKISRYDIRHHKNKDAKLGYLHINIQPPFQGIPTFYYIKTPHNETELLKFVEGDGDSTAKKIAEFIANSPLSYPLINKYSLIGPNCGTYVEWVLEHFPELQTKLPWNAIGKNYSVAKM